MSVWICAPSIRPGGGTLPQWREAGYKVAVCRQGAPFPEADLSFPRETYGGWAASINFLVKFVMNVDKDAEWFVGGADDVLPDPSHTPELIAFECGRHFGDAQAQFRMEHIVSNIPNAPSEGRFPWSAFGVMQPTGDLRLWPNSRIDTFAGSPWIGRSFAERAYGGKGPMFDGYRHAWSDQELQEVAIKLRVFWQRPDLIHKHLHQMREGGLPLPPGIWESTAGRDYTESMPLFKARQAAGFPGHEPLP